MGRESNTLRRRARLALAQKIHRAVVAKVGTQEASLGRHRALACHLDELAAGIRVAEKLGLIPEAGNCALIEDAASIVRAHGELLVAVQSERAAGVALVQAYATEKQIEEVNLRWPLARMEVTGAV